MNGQSRINVSIIVPLFIFSSVIFCQTNDEQIQTGLDNYNAGNYAEAYNNFNSLVQQMTPNQIGDLPLTGESQEVDDTESVEVDDSESQVVEDSESQETYTGESQIQTVDVSTVEQYSDEMEYQGDDPADIYLYRGQANLKLGNKQAALDDFDTAISLDPSYSDAYFRRAIANYEVNPKKVCPDLQKAIDNGHQSAQELYNLICK
jgi:tetratricopeptide (TPR) repeat protein